MYCIDCRALHRERSSDEFEDLTLCDKTKGKKCEVVRSWQDHRGNKHIEPFQLYKANHLPMELYERIIQLSEYTEYEGKKKKGHYQNLTALEYVMNTFAPSTMSIDEMDTLIQKILLIHNVRFTNFLNRLNS